MAYVFTENPQKSHFQQSFCSTLSLFKLPEGARGYGEKEIHIDKSHEYMPICLNQYNEKMFILSDLSAFFVRTC